MTSNLQTFFQPRGVAVIGASRDPLKLGHGVVRNLLQYHYDGAIYPINPKAAEILGLRAYASVREVPDPVELAMIVVPAPMVPEALVDCGERGVGYAVIISGGFREVGLEGAEREAEAIQVAQQYGIRLLGPNCIGTIDTHMPINTTFVVGMPVPGDIAFLSQSGAVCAAVIDWARGAGVGLSRLVSLGNQADVNEAEMLSIIGADGYTRVVVSYIEGVSDGPAFLEAATDVAQQMPVLALKVGRSEGGAKAVASHTGALAGREEAYEAAFRRAGVLRARTMEELFDWARAMAWQPLPAGNRVGILTNAGGPGILALDTLEAAGMQLAPLTEETKNHLRKRVPAAASVNNPVDILAGSGPATYALCLDALLNDETVDAVIVIQAPQDWFAPVSLAEVIGEIGGRRKPVLAVLMGLASVSDAIAVLHRRRIPNFAFPERVGSTLAAMWQRRQWLDSLSEPVEPIRPERCDEKAADAALKTSSGDGWLTPDQAEVLLDAYCIQTPGAGLVATTEDDAVRLAEQVGYPVVLKLASPDIVHKSELGGVILNIDGPEELRQEYRAMIGHAETHTPEATIEGVHVQKMIPAGVELIVGVVRDPQFGPLVMVGGGGTHVELMRDVTFELAPLTAAQAEAMLSRTRAARLLAGFRGAPPADRAAVVDVILRLAQLAIDHPELAEIEINPLMVMAEGGGAWAVDARARVAASE
jgi:acetyltransferase